MWKGKKVSVVFSTYDEKETIRDSIDRFFKTGVIDEVVAVDNNAVAGTKEEILNTKAKYFHEPKQGIGFGYQRALREATGDIIITTEIDGTYVPEDVFKLLAYSDDFDAVFGTRTTAIMIGKGSNMGFAMKWANWLFAKIIEVLFGTVNLTDVGCLYRLTNRKNLDKLKDIRMDGRNSYAVDFMLHLIRNDIRFIEAPVNFHKRVGQSHGAANYWKATKVALGMMRFIIKHRLNMIKTGRNAKRIIPS